MASEAYIDFDNDFVNPSYILGKHPNPFPIGAQATVIEYADFLAAQGPWSVINKTALAPSGNIHDYLSWAPYWWPNCTGVGNTSELTPQQIWVECPYYDRDGLFNPDRLLVNNTGAFEAMSDAVLYNALAWVLTGATKYSANTAHYIDTWFVNNATAQTPNLEYAQMHRGPDGQVGDQTGLLDFHQMAKLVSGVLILIQGNSSAWTTALNTQFMDWITNYIDWVNQSPLAQAEKASTNNHGTYFYNQFVSLQILVGDIQGATSSIQEYFSGIYQGQISSTGEQPLEASRTHPYHYRCYNLAAMITNARIGEYLGLNFWNFTTAGGATIKMAADFAMAQNLTEVGDGPLYELYPSLATVAAVYGDPGGTYAAFLAAGDSNYRQSAYYLWDQEL
ncbi:chondroitin AC/alginate lyase [Athelia psychrophila]|uniref:Chondroitin AC/alginate lyase n=1 Tax=Athelia psychrophila TaxID=1759441 RepID=A0A166XEL9_9AGAM|nr:chondroitin AC/alginate lyase [Fibularhizoctonia sp. CBS 109695]